MPQLSMRIKIGITTAEFTTTTADKETAVEAEEHDCHQIFDPAAYSFNGGWLLLRRVP